MDDGWLAGFTTQPSLMSYNLNMNQGFHPPCEVQYPREVYLDPEQLENLYVQEIGLIRSF